MLPFLGVGAIAAIVGTGAILALGPGAGPLTEIRVAPAAVLLTAPGQTRKLAATGADGTGRPVELDGLRWTSSRKSVATVSGDGTVTAIAEGSSQVVAEAAGGRSAPVLVVVTEPAAGVTLVADAQVVGPPAAVDPGAPPSWDNLYRVTLSGLTPTVGERLLGTGGQPVAGEVVEVSAESGDAVVTLRLVPLHELLPNLRLDETIDLTGAPVVVPEDIAQLYDVERKGQAMTFTPKADFAGLAAQAQADAAARAMNAAMERLGPVAAAGAVNQVAAVTAADEPGTYPFDLPPFKCKANHTTIPIQLSTPPVFSVELSPSLDVAYDPEDRLRHWRLNVRATGKVDVGVKAAAAFEAKVACEATLYTIQIPVSGPLSIFLAGLIPVKAGVEIGGKVTLASLEVGADVTATATGRLGIVCAAPAGCAGLAELADPTATFKPRIDGPSLVGDLRLEPSIEASISVEGAMGSPLLETLRLNVAKAKIGAKLGADLAPSAFQVRNAEYASSYKASLEGGASVGGQLFGDESQLGAIAAMLGLGTITVAEIKVTKDLATSPTGTLKPSSAEYAAGESGTATLELAPAAVSFGPLYNVKEVLLVRFSAGSMTGLDAVDATDGQTTFNFEFTAPADLQASELHAFVVTRLLPGDSFQLELGRTLPRPPVTITDVVVYEESIRACENGPGYIDCDEILTDGSPEWSDRVSVDGPGREAEAELEYTLTYVDGQLSAVDASGSGRSFSTGTSGGAETSFAFQLEFAVEGDGELPFRLWIDFETESAGELDYVDCDVAIDGEFEWEYECEDEPGYSDVIEGTVSEGIFQVDVGMTTSATSTQLVTWRNGGSGSFVVRLVLGEAALASPAP